jgi:hypothetical protein
MKTFQELTEGIETFEDVCAKRGDNPADILPFPLPVTKRQHAANDRERIDYICEYLQDGFEADYSKYQEKWTPWFTDNGSGFGFADSYYDHTATHAGVGSRLSLPTEELSDFFGKKFEVLHVRWLINKY